MRIVLEKKDLIQLLGKALGSELDPEKVEISSDPFEVTLQEAEKVLKSASMEEPPKKEKVSTPEESNVPQGPEPKLDDLLGANDALISNPPEVGKVGGSSTQSPPPTRRGMEQ